MEVVGIKQEVLRMCRNQVMVLVTIGIYTLLSGCFYSGKDKVSIENIDGLFSEYISFCQNSFVGSDAERTIFAISPASSAGEKISYCEAQIGKIYNEFQERIQDGMDINLSYFIANAEVKSYPLALINPPNLEYEEDVWPRYRAYMCETYVPEAATLLTAPDISEALSLLGSTLIRADTIYYTSYDCVEKIKEYKSLLERIEKEGLEQAALKNVSNG